MFIENGFLPENKFWKYLIGSVVVIFASVIGQIPLLLAVFVKSFSSGKEMPQNGQEIMTVLEPNTTLFLALLSFVFAFIAFLLVAKYFHKQSLLSLTTSRKRVDWKRVFFSFGSWSLITIVSIAVLYYSNPESFVVNFKPVPFFILAIIAVFLIPIQTSTEEYIFRGYLMQGFALLSRNKWLPLLMTSVIFGTMHIANPEVEKMGYIILVYYIGTGLFLGIITLMDEGMELALGFHAANNLVSALLVTSDWSVFQTNSILKDVSMPSVGSEILAPVFIIFPILLFIFSKKYKWTNWKEKLTGTIDNNIV
jgi:membrane protease YdiL (CAAX protease family)